MNAKEAAEHSQMVSKVLVAVYEEREHFEGVDVLKSSDDAEGSTSKSKKPDERITVLIHDATISVLET